MISDVRMRIILNKYGNNRSVRFARVLSGIKTYEGGRAHRFF